MSGEHEAARITALEAEVARLRRDAAERGLAYIGLLEQVGEGTRSIDHGVRAAFVTMTGEAEAMAGRLRAVEARLARLEPWASSNG